MRGAPPPPPPHPPRRVQESYLGASQWHVLNDAWTLGLPRQWLRLARTHKAYEPWRWVMPEWPPEYERPVMAYVHAAEDDPELGAKLEDAVRALQRPDPRDGQHYIRQGYADSPAEARHLEQAEGGVQH